MYLTGFGVKIRVSKIESRSDLEIVDGREYKRTMTAYAFQPREIPFDSIFIDGHSGYISFQALHWLARNNIPVFVLNYNGELISSTLPPMPIKADLREAQFQAARDLKKKFTIAKAFVEAKIARSLQLLEWLGERYDIEREKTRTKREAMKLSKASTVIQLRTVEGRVALRYWEGFGKALPESLGFKGRLTSSHQNNAINPVNLALNYGYGYLEGECRKAVNIIGLELAVGFLHDFSNYQTKQSLVYDLQEPFRWLIDLTVMKAFESEKLACHDFYINDDYYRYYFDNDAKHIFRELLREEFNSGVRYKGRILKWDTVIQQKTSELAKYLSGSTETLSFMEPAPVLERFDSRAVREAILTLSQKEANERGIGKSTLHYLRKRAEARKPFLVYSPVREKIAV